MEPTNPNTGIESEAGWRDVFNLIQKGSVETDETYAFLDPPLTNDEIGRFEHYRVLRKLGEGGMGIVFLAEDPHLKRRVALKIMHPHSAAQSAARQRFLREAQAMAAIHHEHVAVVYQVNTTGHSPSEEDLPFLAMQYLEGETLQSRLAREKRLPAAEAARIGREIAEGLAAAHAKGLIHRDIKPTNIWLAAPRSRVKILDFGLARSAEGDAQISRAGQIIGTPYFMAPEQARGQAIDARADLFSLGCVLYAMCAGSLPFDGRSPMAVLMRLGVDEPEPLLRKAPATPVPLAALAHRLMAKQPQERPATAAEVATALAEIELACDRSGQTIADKLFEQPTICSAGIETMAATTTCEVTPPIGKPLPGEPARKIAGIQRRHFLLGAGALAATGAGWFIVDTQNRRGREPDPNKALNGPLPSSNDPILVGLLCSLTGVWRDRETPMMQIVQTAIGEINDKGGLLGRPVKAIVRDGASEQRIFAAEASRLIMEDHVRVLIGGGASVSRKSVKEVVERHRHLLIYPARHEGLESSPHIVYIGATPNQYLVPAIDVALERNPRAGKFFLVGSDRLFSRAVHAIARHAIAARKGAVIGEEMLPPVVKSYREIAGRIARAEPTLILNSVAGSQNHGLLAALRAAGIASSKTPIVSFDLDEQTLRGLPSQLVAGDYIASNYVSTTPGFRNKEFVDRYRAQWGDAYAISDAMEAAYLGVQFWAQAVEKAQTAEPTYVCRAFGNQHIDAPEGPDVRIDPDNQHAWRYFRLGQIRPDGSIHNLRTSEKALPPVPFPNYRPQAEWEQLLLDWHKEWHGNWSPPRG